MLQITPNNFYFFVKSKQSKDESELFLLGLNFYLRWAATVQVSDSFASFEWRRSNGTGILHCQVGIDNYFGRRRSPFGRPNNQFTVGLHLTK